jgi:hypothetical protein
MASGCESGPLNLHVVLEFADCRLQIAKPASRKPFEQCVSRGRGERVNAADWGVKKASCGCKVY